MSGSPPSKIRIIVVRCLYGLLFFFVIGLLFPLVGHPKEHPRRAEARTLVLGLAAAAKAYATEYGAPVSGSPAQIMATWRGDNPRKIVFFDAYPSSFNAQGEAVDPWGTPVRFDLSDPQKPRVWSCGGNRKDESGAEGSDDIVSWR